MLDGRDVMDDPAGVLAGLCEALGLPWDPGMLSWSAGPRDTDGVWGPHWYSSVWQSTSFVPWTPRAIRIPDDKRHLLDQLQPLYDQLHPHRIRSQR